MLVGDALDTYTDYHDQLVRRQSRQVDGNIQGILSKARGYKARLAMILFALEKTLTHIIEGECDVCPNTSWGFDISSSCTRAACTIMDYLIQQKLIIMDVTEVDEHNTLHADQLVQIPDAKRMRRLLLLPLEDNDGQITPSKLAQKHICAPTDGKYTVVKALELFSSASSMGFGEQVDHVVPSTNRKVSRFRKTPYPLLSSNARKRLETASYHRGGIQSNFSNIYHTFNAISRSRVLVCHVYVILLPQLYNFRALIPHNFLYSSSKCSYMY